MAAVVQAQPGLGQQQSNGLLQATSNVQQLVTSPSHQRHSPPGGPMLLVGIQSTVPRPKEIISAKVKSDELFLRFLASPQARALVQQLIDRRSSDPPEVLLPSPSSSDLSAPELLSPARHVEPRITSPSRKGAADDKYTLSPRKLDYSSSTSRTSKGPLLASSPPPSPSTKGASTSKKRMSPRTPKHKQIQAPLPLTPILAPPPNVQSIFTLPVEHFVGASGLIWRDGYSHRDASVIDSEIHAIEQLFSETGSENIDVWPKVSSEPADPMLKLLRLLSLPIYCRSAFAQRIGSSDGSNAGVITSISKQKVLAFYHRFLKFAEPVRRAFNVIRSDSTKSSLTPSDWHAIVRFIADTHPGLAFLRESGDFLPRYVETVVVRLFHQARSSRVAFRHTDISALDEKATNVAAALLANNLHTSAGGSCRRKWEMSFRDFATAGLCNILQQLETLQELTRYPAYFDYISFYTIYCKFWELDTDHDLLLRRDDMLRYENYSLNSRIVDALFEVCRFNIPFTKLPPKPPPPPPVGSSSIAPSRLGPDHTGAPSMDLSPSYELPMTYQDFVYFILSEVDQSACSSVEMWFHCLDVDGDGFLSPRDIYHVYEEQMYRMEFAAMEVLPFEHAFCQILDMINPKHLDRITLNEMKQSGQAPDVFHLLFNLTRFESDEQKYPLDPETQAALVSAVDANQTASRQLDAAMHTLHQTCWYRWAISEYQAALGEALDATGENHDADVGASDSASDNE